MTNWNTEIISIETFLKRAPQIDVHPIGQRLSVEKFYNSTTSTPSKAQSIIAAIFMGLDLSEIKIVRTESKSDYPFESIDGGHRKRAILNFVSNKFPIHKSFPEIGGLYFRQLDEATRERFLSYELRIVCYPVMNNVEKGRFFRQSNNSTPVNHQEMLNSYGDTAVANFVRETVRIVPRVNNDTHPLFDYSINSKGEDIYKYLAFANRRLDHDERVARITYLVWKDRGLDACDKAELEELYESKDFNDEMTCKKVFNKVKACLDFMYEIAKVRRVYKKSGLSQQDFNMLMRLYIYMKDKYGDFKIEDAEEFFRAYETAMLKFVGRDEKKLISDQIKDGNDIRLRHEAFRGYLTVHTSKRKAVDTCKWLIEVAGFDPFENGLKKLDSRRAFSRAMIEDKLAEQGFKCWVTGEKLTMKDAQGAHIRPHSKGGETIYENLVVVSAEHNRKMGEMNAYDYLDLWKNNQRVA